METEAFPDTSRTAPQQVFKVFPLPTFLRSAVLAQVLIPFLVHFSPDLEFSNIFFPYYKSNCLMIKKKNQDVSNLFEMQGEFGMPGVLDGSANKDHVCLGISRCMLFIPGKSNFETEDDIALH